MIIYSITNRIDNKRYIGQSINELKIRKLQHLIELRKNSHYNQHLQSAWNKYGEENFEFKILENNCKDLNFSEKKWILLFNTIDNNHGYNMNFGGSDSSSKDKYRRVCLFDKNTGLKKYEFNTVAECCRFLKIHTSSGHGALKRITSTVEGYYIRDYIEGVDVIDHNYLKKVLKQSRRRAGKISKQVKKRVIEGYDKLLSIEELLPMITGELNEDNIQIHGIDLNVIKISKLEGIGIIPKEGKTKLPTYIDIDLVDNKWELQPGYYNVEFAQGCNIANYAMLLIRQRSSLLRCGGIISSSIFDSGFKTDSIGTMMVVHNPMVIEFKARIACIYGHACDFVKEEYSGQWQGDKQRNEGK